MRWTVTSCLFTGAYRGRLYSWDEAVGSKKTIPYHMSQEMAPWSIAQIGGSDDVHVQGNSKEGELLLSQRDHRHCRGGAAQGYPRRCPLQDRTKDEGPIVEHQLPATTRLEEAATAPRAATPFPIFAFVG